jgi:hypothetical protein
MSQSLIIEILLALLALAIGVGSFIGSNKAGKAQAEVAIVNIDAQAYERAKAIYESAINTLERRVTYLEGQVDHLTVENARVQLELENVRQENAALKRERGKNE